MKRLSLLFLLLSISSLIFAQNDFEGTLVYSAKYSGDKELIAKVASSMPDTMELQFKEGKSFFEMSGGMSAALMNRMYAEPRGGELYLIATSQNMNYKFTPESQKQAWANPKNEKAVVVKGKKDQKIGPYDCKHYLVIQDTRRGRDTMDIWVAPQVKVDFPNTNDLTGSGLFSVSQYGVEGFPMKIVHPMPVPGRTIYITLELASALPDEVTENRLKLPAGYQMKEYNMVPPKR
jgi:hypothetical protein